MKMDLDKNIEDYNLIILDLETTGLDVVTGDSICEIGAVKVKERKIIDKFHSLINPGRSVSQEAYRIHKISNEELRDAPYFREVSDKLIYFLKDSVICAYNVKFDMGFIDHSLKREDYPPLDFPAVDILSMARDILKLPRYNLDAVAKFFNIDISGGLHRASDDAMVACDVFFELLNIFKEKKIEKLEEFISLYGLSNEIFKLREDRKVLSFNEAIDKKLILRIKYFSSDNIIKDKKIMPLRVFQEKQCYCLLCQDEGGDISSIGLNRILEIKTSSPEEINLL